jgi:outer membrane lipoprotein
MYYPFVGKDFKKRSEAPMKRILSFLLIMSLTGCAHVISLEMREKAEKELPFAALLNDPDRYMGRYVLLGGVIANASNKEEGTYIEVVQKPLDYMGRPKDTDYTEGRFLVLYGGYLDTAVYSRGKEVTVAGRVVGKKVQPLGEI